MARCPAPARFWPTWAPAPRGPRAPRARPRANESGPAVCLSRRAPRRTHASGRGAPHRLGVFGDLLGAVLAARAARCVVFLCRYEQRDNRYHVVAALLGAGCPGLGVSRELGGVASRPRSLVLPVLDFPARQLVDPGDVIPEPGVLRGDEDHRASPSEDGGHDHQHGNREAVHGPTSLARIADTAPSVCAIPQLERLIGLLHWLRAGVM